MPAEPRPTRRALVVTAALLPTAVTLAGCKDDPDAGSGTPGAVNGSRSTQGTTEPKPTVDPAVVAALSTVATQVTQVSQLYATATRKFPALRTKLAAGAKYHASHLAKLKETEGVAAKAVQAASPASAAAALTAIAAQEKAMSVAHAAAAAKLSGAPARLLATIAAAEVQLGSTLLPAKKTKKDAS